MTPPSPTHPLVPDAWSFAQDLARSGRSVALDGIVSHNAGAATIAMYAAFGSGLVLLAMFRPMWGVPLLLLTVWSALRDMDGGTGWVRNLLVREVGHTIIVWPDGEPVNGPDEMIPTLVITAPLDTKSATQSVPAWALMLLLAAGLVGAIASIARIHWPGPATVVALVCASLLVLSGVISWSSHYLGSRNRAENAAREALSNAMPHLPATRQLRVVIALVGGGVIHHDGIEALLCNHRHRLDPASTRVLTLHPSGEPLSAVATEGRVRGRPADPTLLSILQAHDVALTKGTTGAARALAHGWPAAGLMVASDQTHRVMNTLVKLVIDADNLAGDNRW